MKIIQLKTGEGCMVDDLDFEKVNKYKWYRSNRGNGLYATAYINRLNVTMSRFILQITDSNLQVDHKDHNTLNNTRDNLRICTNGKNGKNRKGWGKSKYKGVHWTGKKWEIRLTNNGKRTYYGSFQNEILAAQAYNRIIAETKDNFRKPNIIP